MRDAGIDGYDKNFYSMMRAAVDFSYHAEFYFRDPNDPNLPLQLEPWQKYELGYAQYGEAFDYIATKKRYNIAEVIQNESLFDKGNAVVRKVAINSPRGFGKSIFSAVAADEFILHRPYTQVALFSTSKDQAQDLMEKVRYFVKHSIFAYMIDPKNNSKTEFGLINGSKVKAFPQSEVTIRGFHPHVKIIDEKARIKREILESSIRPMGRHTCKIEIGISTPFGMNNNHYEDCAGKNKKYFHTHLLQPTEVRWVDDKKLASDAATIGSRIARQELYAEFLSSENTVYSPDLVARMYNPKLTIAEEGTDSDWYIIGTDFGKHTDYTTMVVAHKDKRGYIIVDRIERYIHMSYENCVDRICNLCELFNVKLIVPDGNGVGIAIMEMLISKLAQYGLRVMIYKTMLKKAQKEKKKHLREAETKDEDIRFGFIFNNNSKLNIADELLRVMMNNKIQCPDHGGVDEDDTTNPMHVFKVLENEAIAFQYKFSNSMNIILGHPDGEDSHDDVLIGLMLCVWGFRFLDTVRRRKENMDNYDNGSLLHSGRVPVRTYGRP